MWQVTQANRENLDAVSHLFDAYRVFYGQQPNLEEAKAFISERMENDQSVIFVATDSNGKAVGFAQMFPMFSSVGLSRTYVLNDLYVDPEVRRNGIASLLLEEAAKYGRSTGALRLQLCTARDNLQAKALYESKGWELNTAFDYYSLTL